MATASVSCMPGATCCQDAGPLKSLLRPPRQGIASFAISCTAGKLLASHDLLEARSSTDRLEIRCGLGGWQQRDSVGTRSCEVQPCPGPPQAGGFWLPAPAQWPRPGEGRLQASRQPKP